MPTLVIIDGISILMYLNDHDPPHVHVRQRETEARIEIGTGQLISGQLARRALRKVQAWIELNRDSLFEAWQQCQSRS